MGYYVACSGNLFPEFGTTYRSHLQGSRIKKETFLRFSFDSPSCIIVLVGILMITIALLTRNCLPQTPLAVAEYMNTGTFRLYGSSRVGELKFN